MRSALRIKLLIIFLCCTNWIFAQENVFKSKQDSLHKKDNLTDWIYDRLDYVSAHPQQRITFLYNLNKASWRKPKTQTEQQAWLDYLNTIGYYQLQEGKILEAINSYENALTYFEINKKSFLQYDIIEYTLKPLSNNYTRLGDYERALYLQKKSIEILKNQSNIKSLPSIYGNMAISYRSMGNLEAAEKSIKNGLALAKPSDSINFLLYNIYGDILCDARKWKEAKSLVENNISKQKTINLENAYWLMSAYTTSGKINLALNNFTLAEKNFNQSLFILNKYYNGFKIRERANVLTQLGKTKNLQQKPLQALEFFNSTLKTLKIIHANNQIDQSKIYGENKLMEVFEEMSIAYGLLQNPDEAFKNIKLALYAADKIRIEFADDKTKERLQADTKNIAEKGIEICYNQYLKTGKQKYLNFILNLSEQSKSRTLMDQIQRNQKQLSLNKTDTLLIKKQALERAIVLNEKQNIEFNKINKNTEALKFDLALINKQIKEKYKNFNSFPLQFVEDLKNIPNSRILTYFFGRKAIYLLDINNRKINRISKIIDAEKVKLAIQAFNLTYFQQGPNAMINDPKSFFSNSNFIFQTILANTNLSNNEPIIIIPDGALGYISFDGLITNPHYSNNVSNWPFLIKSNTITYAFSLKILAASKSNVNNKTFTGLFITHQKQNNKPLLAVKQEADSIKKTINGKFLFNDEVNIKSFGKAFEESKILHIGTHAYLSGKNAEPTLDFDKEKLYLFELATKKTSPLLVVLSACKTADGILANGEGIISLSRGFSAIGTPATIAGLWNVNDNAASIITANFYKYLIEGKSNGEALHLAKLNWLNRTQNSDAMYLPYYWDSLIYMGKNQTILLEKATAWRTTLIVAIGLVLALIIVFILLKHKKSKSLIKK